jgi:H+/Cl- antiporter ClcA
MYEFPSNRASYLTLVAILSFVLLVIYFPFLAGFIWFLAIGFAILVTVYKSYRKGFIGVNLKYKYVVYERRNKPFAFWFFMIVGAYIGMLGCVASIFFLLHKFPNLGLR